MVLFVGTIIDQSSHLVDFCFFFSTTPLLIRKEKGKKEKKRPQQIRSINFLDPAHAHYRLVMESNKQQAEEREEKRKRN